MKTTFMEATQRDQFRSHSEFVTELKFEASIPNTLKYAFLFTVMYGLGTTVFLWNWMKSSSSVSMLHC